MNIFGIKLVYLYDFWIEMFMCFLSKIGLLFFFVGVSNFYSINKFLMKMNMLMIKKSNIFGIIKFYIVIYFFLIKKMF